VNLPSKTFTYRKKIFQGRTEERRETITGENWNVQEEMAPNTAVILELEP
jgi:hypothetical protein